MLTRDQEQCYKPVLLLKRLYSRNQKFPSYNKGKVESQETEVLEYPRFVCLFILSIYINIKILSTYHPPSTSLSSGNIPVNQRDKKAATKNGMSFALVKLTF